MGRTTMAVPGMPSAQGLDDPRFKQRVREIDAVLDAKGLH